MDLTERNSGQRGGEIRFFPFPGAFSCLYSTAGRCLLVRRPAANLSKEGGPDRSSTRARHRKFSLRMRGDRQMELISSSSLSRTRMRGAHGGSPDKVVQGGEKEPWRLG